MRPLCFDPWQIRKLALALHHTNDQPCQPVKLRMPFTCVMTDANTMSCRLLNLEPALPLSCSLISERVGNKDYPQRNLNMYHRLLHDCVKSAHDCPHKLFNCPPSHSWMTSNMTFPRQEPTDFRSKEWWSKLETFGDGGSLYLAIVEFRILLLVFWLFASKASQLPEKWWRVASVPDGSITWRV